MALLEIASGLLVLPFFSVLVMILLLASFGKSFGVRRLYVKFLLRLFEVRAALEVLIIASQRKSNANLKFTILKMKCVVIENLKLQQLFSRSHPCWKFSYL